MIVPHAGGGPAFYRSWARSLRGEIEPWAVCLPGRESRWREPAVTDWPTLIQELSSAILGLGSSPIHLFGHSLGGLIAFELARRVPTVARLTLAGAAAPGSSHPATHWHDLGDPQLVEKLKSLGGTPTAVLENPELLEIALPSLRADLRLLHSYRPGDGVLRHPLTAIGGLADPFVPLVDLRGWARTTTATCRVFAVPGGHFLDPRIDLPATAPGVLQLIDLNQPPDSYWPLLDEPESARARRFAKPELRDRFVVCHGTLRATLARLTGQSPAKIAIETTASGKPILASNNPEDWRFNLSHSGSWAVLAIVRGQEVGIDIERVRDDIDHAALAHRYFAPAEIACLSGSGKISRQFFGFWTGKEAYSKARGLGLNLPLDSYSVTLDDSDMPCQVDEPGQMAWTIIGVNAVPGMATAIATERPVPLWELL